MGQINDDDTDVIPMRCSIEGCPGQYERKQIVHTARQRGQVIVIDHVPAQVCSTCGDVLLEVQTSRHIEDLLKKTTQPSRTARLYEYV